MILATVSPIVDPEQPITTTAIYKSNIAITISMPLASPGNPIGLT